MDEKLLNGRDCDSSRFSFWNSLEAKSSNQMSITWVGKNNENFWFWSSNTVENPRRQIFTEITLARPETKNKNNRHVRITATDMERHLLWSSVLLVLLKWDVNKKRKRNNYYWSKNALHHRPQSFERLLTSDKSRNDLERVGLGIYTPWRILRHLCSRERAYVKFHENKMEFYVWSLPWKRPLFALRRTSVWPFMPIPHTLKLITKHQTSHLYSAQCLSHQTRIKINM